MATAVHLSMTLGKPLLVEGHPGVGKTEIAKVLASVLQGDLIRLQCYEGLDATTALYEWNYPKQLLHIKLEEHGDHAGRGAGGGHLQREVPAQASAARRRSPTRVGRRSC